MTLSRDHRCSEHPPCEACVVGLWCDEHDGIRATPAEGIQGEAAASAGADPEPREEERTYTEDEYLDYGVIQYRRGRAQAEAEAAQGTAPRAEGLREALEHVLDVWPAPSPEEFARLHRVLTGHDSCSSRPSDERVPESEEMWPQGLSWGDRLSDGSK